MVVHVLCFCAAAFYWPGLWRLPGALLPAALLLLCLGSPLVHFPVKGFEIVEKEDIFRAFPCPAFLMFDSAAYLSDMTLELPCHCKPEEMNSVVWYYQKNLGSQHTKVLTDFNGIVQMNPEKIDTGDLSSRFSIRIFSLIVFRAQTKDTGHYICGTNDGQYFYGYDVDIQEAKFTRVSFLDQAMHPQPPYSTKYFDVFTTFWEWTKCDRCDVRGEQTRLGLCYIRTKYLNPRYQVKEDEIASCGSAAVPHQFKKLITAWKPELAIRSCLVGCKKKVKGFFNKIKVKLMDNIKKLKEKFAFTPKVPTQIHTHTLGSTLVLACPRAKPQHAVAWDKGDRRMYRTDWLNVQNKTKRVYIDHGSHLHFRFLENRDKGVYYCWLEGKLKAGFQLSILKNPEENRKFTDPESIFAMKIFGYCFLFFTIIFVVIHCLKCFHHNFTCVSGIG